MACFAITDLINGSLYMVRFVRASFTSRPVSNGAFSLITQGCFSRIIRTLFECDTDTSPALLLALAIDALKNHKT